MSRITSSRTQRGSVHHGTQTPSPSSLAMASRSGMRCRQFSQNAGRSTARPSSAKRLRKKNSNARLRSSSHCRQRCTVCRASAKIGTCTAQRAAGEQQEQNLLLKRPVVPAARRDAQRQTRARAAAGSAAKTQNGNRIEGASGAAIGLAMVAAMRPQA
jgi:hypothetical protein